MLRACQGRSKWARWLSLTPKGITPCRGIVLLEMATQTRVCNHCEQIDSSLGCFPAGCPRKLSHDFCAFLMTPSSVADEPSPFPQATHACHEPSNLWHATLRGCGRLHFARDFTLAVRLLRGLSRWLKSHQSACSMAPCESELNALHARHHRALLPHLSGNSMPSNM